MGISGSDQAYRQARSGIEICDASRTGYYSYTIACRINGVSVEADKRSLRITRSMGSASRASLRLRSNVTPVVGQEILIGIGGTTSGRIFGGTILDVNQVAASQNFEPAYEVLCTDWTYAFDRRLITEYFPTMSVTGIAREIIDRYTTGFSHVAIAEGLPVIEGFPVTNAHPSKVFDRLANLIDGIWQIDPFKVVHLFSLADGEPTRTTDPATLNASNRQYWDLSYEVDLNLVRTRVFVEGQGTRILADVPAGLTTIPIEMGFGQSLFDTVSPTRLIMVPEYGQLAFTTVASGIGIASTVTSGAAAGATSLTIDDASSFPNMTPEYGWALVGADLYIRFTQSNFGTPGVLSGIAPFGSGSITRTIEAGETITLCSFLVGVSFITDTIAAGREVYNVTMREDTAKQAALAALEGGDGIHEFYIRDRRLNVATAIALANAELAAFGQGIESAAWFTTDPNVGIGKRQEIATTGRSNITASLIIHRIDTDWADGRHLALPRQHVQAKTTFPKGFMETVATPPQP
jgi:hypothetical protein